MSARKQLLHSAALHLVSGLLFLGALLFGSAGTLAYPQAWLLLALVFLPSLALGAALLYKAPELVSARLPSREGGATSVIASSGILFLCAFVLAAMDYRIGWSNVPAWLIGAAAVIFLLAYILVAEVLYENAALARARELLPGRPMRGTGPYGVVRHPMYAATAVLFLSVPLVLGSLIAFAVMLIYPAVIVLRIGAEERALERSEAGYAAYKQRVRYRLIPFIW